MKKKSIAKEMNECFGELNMAEQESVLQMVKTFLKTRQTKKRLSLKKYNREIDEAMARIDAGKFLTNEEVEKEAIRW